MRPPSVPSTHYEVVDDRDQLVGDMHHATEVQARQLLSALSELPGVGRLHVALVTETMVVQRHTQRLPSNSMTGRQQRMAA